MFRVFCRQTRRSAQFDAVKLLIRQNEPRAAKLLLGKLIYENPRDKAARALYAKISSDNQETTTKPPQDETTPSP